MTKIHYSFLKILNGSDLSRRRLPYMTADSGNGGPVVWLTACCHGDEVGGIVIIQELFKTIRKKGLATGVLHAFPMMNPIGFENRSRHIPFTREDLNRMFPGNPRGTLGERMAHIIFEKITATGPALVIDLHTDWIRSIPYALIDAVPASLSCMDTYRETESFAETSGLLMIRDTEILSRSLSHCLLEKKIPSLTLELGESYVINEKNIGVGVTAVENLLAALGMLPADATASAGGLPKGNAGKIFKYSNKPYSSCSGIIRFLARPGDTVIAGKPVARIYNTFGKLMETLRAPATGIVLGHADSSVAFPGLRVMAFGCTEPVFSQP